jgi:hypothetical protein
MSNLLPTFQTASLSLKIAKFTGLQAPRMEVLGEVAFLFCKIEAVSC